MGETGGMVFDAGRLEEFARRVFVQFGVRAADAEEAARILSLADLRGIDSHGIARLHAYSRMLDKGRINPAPEMTIVRETAGTATVDGDNGLGLIVGPWANRLAMEKAETVGTGWVAVRGSNHFGIAGYYVLEALERDQLGWAMTNTTKIVAPCGGLSECWAPIPSRSRFRVVRSRRSSLTWRLRLQPTGKSRWRSGRTNQFPRVGQSIGMGYRQPNPTRWPTAGRCCHWDRQGNRGHKGYCLGAMIDLLSGAL
ncbi:MAG: hypothetical protein CM1200mP2_24870 [Planctomycetaceae bacterium]|nr:MAG: hypothetical protein CM1200mP2_24870 [Planctomycetaceae bacterium]